jgi:outer membrane receptor protein involved in Fe transport
MEFRITRIAAAVAALSAFSASAQEAPAPASGTAAPAADSKSPAELQTVTVTANKRKEDANKVGLSLSVLKGDDLVAEHITNFEDSTRSIPNISFSGGGGGGNAGNGPGLSNIEMRGISSQAGSATVGVYMDDVSMTVGNLYSMGIAEPKFFDLDRVEVLRGPQGTLYGASSMGGTVKFIANQPNLKEQEASVYTEVSNTEGGGTNYVASGVYNAVLIPDQLAFRIGAETGHRAGYINQVSPFDGAPVASGINYENDSVLRMAAKWVPARGLTLTPSVFYQQVSTGDSSVTSLALPSSLAITPMTLPSNEAAKLTREPGTDTLVVPSLTLNYALDVGDLTSVTSYYQRKFNRVQDGNLENSNFLASLVSSNLPSLVSAVNALPSPIVLNNQVRQFAEEVRLASHPYDPTVSPFTWLAGAYVSDQHTTVTENDFMPGLTAAFTAAGVSPTDPNAIVNPVTEGFPDDNVYFSVRHYHDQQQSVFGELNYYFDPKIHATLGLRYIRATDSLERTGDYYINYVPGGDPTGYAHSVSDASGNAFTPKFGLTWEVDPTDTVYATAAEGYRIGGSNFSIPASYCGVTNPTSFGSDSLWSYEVGDKSRFLGNRLSINTSAYYVNWKNLQQLISLSCGFNYTTNVGNASSYGAEIEIKARPISSLTLDLAAGLTHATLSDDAGADAGILGAVKGAWVPGVPKYNVALTANYSFNVSGDTYGFVRGASHWTGASYGGFPLLQNGSADPDYVRPAYNTLDFSTGVSRDAWELSFFVKNLLNNQEVIQHPVVQTTVNEAYRVAPREIGLSFSLKM